MRPSRPITQKPWWLFSPRVDVGVFLGSALLTLAALAGCVSLELYSYGALFVAFFILVDLPHVWSTSFRIYLDPKERMRRPGLYYGAPLAIYITCVLTWTADPLYFFRALAYLNIFHIIRQQYGWVILYRRRVGEVGKLGQRFDGLVAYTIMIYPVVVWHSLGQGRIFVDGDMFPILPEVVTFLEPFYWVVLGVYVLRSVASWLGHGTKNPGKDLVIYTTALAFNWCSYFGIPWFVILIHGIPYLALVYWYSQRRMQEDGEPLGGHLGKNLLTFLFALWGVGVLHHGLVSYTREPVKQMFTPYFTSEWTVSPELLLWLVPLTFLPSACHYVLDAFVWRGRDNPDLRIWD